MYALGASSCYLLLYRLLNSLLPVMRRGFCDIVDMIVSYYSSTVYMKLGLVGSISLGKSLTPTTYVSEGGVQKIDAGCLAADFGAF